MPIPTWERTKEFTMDWGPFIFMGVAILFGVLLYLLSDEGTERRREGLNQIAARAAYV